MQGEDSIGGPIQSVALQHLFQQERGTAPPSSGGGSSGSSGGHTQHTHHTEDLFQKCFERNHSARASSASIFKTHPFFDKQRWNTDQKIYRRRSSEALEEMVEA